MDFFFIQMSDPQFGMFARLSGMDEERIQDLLQRNGWNIRPLPKPQALRKRRRFTKKQSLQSTV